VQVVIGVVLGTVYGVWAAWLWGLRKAQGVRPELLLVVLGLSPVVFIWGAELFGWPTPVSIAVSIGALDEPVDRRLLAWIKLGTAVVVAAVLVRSGAMRGLERWSRKPE
jgi:uncharacterized membrane protein (UPF0136 family)